MKESGEMNLETIHVESRKRDHVRSVDVATGLGVTRPSVSRAISHLKNGKYIAIDDSGYITLTDSGRAIALLRSSESFSFILSIKKNKGGTRPPLYKLT